MQYAIDDIDLMSLENEKWAIETESLTTQYEAGLISADEWDEFTDELRTFRVEAVAREVELLTTFLAYQESLGMELTWEEWLQ